MKPKVTRAIRWSNGILMCFDDEGKQVPEYQGVADEVLPRLRKDFPNLAIDEGNWSEGKIWRSSLSGGEHD